MKETRGDVQEAVDTAFYMAGEGRRLFGVTVPSELPNKFAMAVRMPLGVCGMISPWNFPMAIPSWKLFPALVCGNTCVIKPAEDTPLSTINLVVPVMAVLEGSLILREFVSLRMMAAIAVVLGSVGVVLRAEVEAGRESRLNLFFSAAQEFCRSWWLRAPPSWAERS